ncbi:MAG: hypothetical protein AB1478_02710 [Nitrospirota bacterium]
MCGGGAPEVPKEQRELAAEQAELARMLRRTQAPALRQIQRIGLGEDIRTAYQPTMSVESDYREVEVPSELGGYTIQRQLYNIYSVYNPITDTTSKFENLDEANREMERIKTEVAKMPTGIPSQYIPKWERIRRNIEGHFKKAGERIVEAYAPLRGAIEERFGPALLAEAIESIEREYARQKEEVSGIRGLPSMTGRRLEALETERIGQRIQTERIGSLAKSAAMITYEQMLGTEKANLAKALTDFETAFEQQRGMYEPELRKWALAFTAGGVDPSAAFARAAQTYENMYRDQLAKWQMSQQEELAWIGAFADIASSAIGAALPALLA